ncbi:MAG: adenylate/guanylate cyclase domain-containing protein [bacterium]|nr:adenylate/guanylate cyclase domain-containing protein [bacterium]
MSSEYVQRRLTAVLAADVAGYSRLMGRDEEGTLGQLKTLRKTLVDPVIAAHRGRIVKTTGDGMLVEFASAVDAARCAVEVQRGMAAQNADVPQDSRIEFRIGIHVGDIIVDDDDIFGDGVNIAARLEGIAEPGGICISDDAQRQIRGKVDIAFDDMGPQHLKNIAEPMRAGRVRLDGDAASRTTVKPAEAQPLSLPGKPSVAVLPFQNMSGDPEQEHFCDGLVEDIITTLSKLAGLRVIARNSTFVYKGRPVDVREAAKQLGVRYILEGSVRRSGNRIRVTAQLIDAQDGAHLWAERYDRAMDDIFAIQDEITLVLATEMQVKLTEGEQARLQYTTTTNVEAWSCWVQGMSHHRKAITREDSGQARFFWEKALALDPMSAALNAKLGFLHCLDARFGWWDDREVAIDKARSYSDKALEIDPGNADAYTVSSLVLQFQRLHDDAVAAARKAVKLAPGAADTAELASHVLAASGYPNDAVELSERAMTLSPNYPAVYLGTLGNAYRLSGRPEQAIAAFQAYHARNPGFGLTDLVIIYQQTDQPEKARRTAEQLLAARPNFTIAAWLTTQFSRRDVAQVEADTVALRAAGLPPG